MLGRRQKTNVKRLALFTTLLLMGVVGTRAHAVDIFNVSNFGGANQIWFEAEFFDERIPDSEDHFTLSAAPDGEEAFGPDELNTINRAGGAGGRISYSFDISAVGGEAGTWYHWGRVINPSNQSDFILVEGHPGDVIPTAEPFECTGCVNDQRLFERNTGPPFGWSGGGEGHVKELQDGLNTMYIVHRQGNDTVFWDVMMWTDDPSYVPTDDDYLNSTPSIPIDNPGDFNLDGVIDAADYQILVANYNTTVDRGTDGDFTFNGQVDFRDFVAFRSAFEAQPAGAAAIPEPSSLSLFGLGTLLLGGLRRRRLSSVQSQHRPLASWGARFFSITLVAIFAVCAMTTESLAQIIIGQEAGTDYIAWEAQDGVITNVDDATGWIYTDIDPANDEVGGPATQVLPSGSIVLPRNTNASRGDALYDQDGGGDQDWVNYQLQFSEPGTYYLYMHYTMFDRTDPTGYGNEDSVYFPRVFGVPPLGPRGDNNFWASTPDMGASFTAGEQIGGEAVEGQMEGYFHWWRVTAQDPAVDGADSDIKVVTQADVGAVLDFGMAAREPGTTVDRLVMSTNPDLTDDELNALPSFDPFTIGVDPGDFNKDGTVDFADFTILRENFGQTVNIAESFEKGDGTRDGKVNLADFIQFRLIFNAPAGASSVPEPSGIAMGLLAGAAAISLRRRRRRG